MKAAPTSAAQYRVRIASSVDELGGDFWRTSAPSSFYLSYAWLKNVEAKAKGQAFVVAVLDEGETVIAALPGYVVDDEQTYAYADPAQLLLGPVAERVVPFLVQDEASAHAELRGRKAAIASLYPSVVCASLGGYACAPIYRAGFPVHTRPAATRVLVDGVLDLARRRGAGSVAFLYVEDLEADPLDEALRAAGFSAAVLDADGMLSVSWDSFDEYLASRGPRRRASIRREIRAFERSGLTLRGAGPSRLTPRMASWQAALLRKYGHAAEAADIDASFARTRRFLDRSVRVLLAESEGREVGFVLFYEGDREYFPRLGAVDPALPHDVYCHFNLFYYGLIRLAIEERISTIHYGPGSYEAKLARGCMLRLLRGYFLATDPVTNLLVADAAPIVDAGSRRSLDWSAAAARGTPHSANAVTT
jgi:uncharacterized protein